VIRAVIDTNVVVSGLLSPAGNEALILLAIHQGLVRPCFSEEILEEYAGVRVPLGKDAQALSVIDVVIFLGETVVPSVVGSLVASWILSRFRGRAERLIINTKECEFDEGKISKSIEQTIHYERE
jgi:PIN domain